MKTAAVPSILVAVVLLALGVIAEAQQPKKVSRIGYLVSSDSITESSRSEGIRQALRDLGYVEGQNIAFEYRYAEGKLDRLPDLVKELVSVKVDVIVTTSAQSVLTVKNASRTIPVVFSGVQDPVASGIIDSLARPGGNATGLSILAPELAEKDWSY